MDNSFYLKNGSVLWNGAFTPLDMAVEDGHITALSRGHHNEKGLPEVDAAGLRVLPGFLDQIGRASCRERVSSPV